MTDQNVSGQSKQESDIDSRAGSRTGRSAKQPIPDGQTPEEILTAIADPDCRAILAASSNQPLSVSDMVTQCDIPTATAYRKVNTLVDVGLLHERIRIRPYGRNECEYSLQVERVDITLTEGGGARATVSVSGHTHQGHVVVTDGGTGTCDTEESSDHQRLRTLFIDITGTDRLVSEQEEQAPAQHVDATAKESVSEYVTSLAQDDGLSDSLPEPDEEG